MGGTVFTYVWAAGIAVSCAANCCASEDISSSEALKRLTEGNQRFVAGNASNPRCDQARRSETAQKGQKPLATVLTCSDSRVSPEFAFDQGVGDLFVVRVAGNVADTDEIGTIEYGLGHLRTPLLVVMGHNACGAVAAVVGGAELDGSLPALVEKIEPAVRETRKANPAAQNNVLLGRAIEANVFNSIQDVLERSSEIRELTKEGRVRIVGAVYDIVGGGVRWLGPHPEQSKIIYSNKRVEPVEERHAAPKRPTQGVKTLVAGTKAEKHGGGHAVGGAGASQPSGGADGNTRGRGAAGGGMASAASVDHAIGALREGNERFASGAMQNPRRDRERRLATSRGQKPIATVLACSDSRVPVERLFDQGIGDLFVVRFAGNVADTDQIASIEYATGHLETPVLVVLGHTACGAVTAVANGAELHGSLPGLVDNIRPAVARAREANPGLSGNPLLAAAIRANVQQAMSDVLKRSAAVRRRVEEGTLKIVGGVYNLASGKVEWLSDSGTIKHADPVEKPTTNENKSEPAVGSIPPLSAPESQPATPAPVEAEKREDPDSR